MMPCMINTQLCAQVKCKWSAIPSKASGSVSFELWSIEIDQDEIQYVCTANILWSILNVMSFIMFANVAWCDVAKQRKAGQNPFCGG